MELVLCKTTPIYLYLIIYTHIYPYIHIHIYYRPNIYIYPYIQTHVCPHTYLHRFGGMMELVPFKTTPESLSFNVRMCARLAAPLAFFYLGLLIYKFCIFFCLLCVCVCVGEYISECNVCMYVQVNCILFVMICFFVVCVPVWLLLLTFL